jgi:hypothetical protein
MDRFITTLHSKSASTDSIKQIDDIRRRKSAIRRSRWNALHNDFA